MSVAAGSRRGRATAFDHALAPILPVLLTVAAAACAAGMARAAAIVPLHVSLDPNEGWNAYHAASAVAGKGLYPDPAGFMINNYPPLSFYLVGLLGAVVGDQIVAGRIVSFLSFVFVCGFVALLARAFGASRQSAVFSALFLAAFLLVASDYVGMDDPQLLGHAFQMAAVLIVVQERRTRGRMIGAAMLLVAGGFVKHNLFALPLASFFWLAVFDPRNARRLAVAGAVLVVVGLLVFRASFGFDLLDRLDSARSWSLAQLWSTFRDWLPFAAIPLAALAALLAWRPKEPAVAFAGVYAGIAVPMGALLAGGAGVDVNALFDADIALALGGGLALDRLLRQGNAVAHLTGRALAVVSFLPLLITAAASADWRARDFWLHPVQQETALAARDIAFLRAHPGPAVCESLALCYWAGKPASVDVFNFDQQLVTGKRAVRSFLRLINDRRFAAIELDETDPFPLPAAVRNAMDHTYRLDHADDEGTFYTPRAP